MLRLEGRVHRLHYSIFACAASWTNSPLKLLISFSEQLHSNSVHVKFGLASFTNDSDSSIHLLSILQVETGFSKKNTKNLPHWTSVGVLSITWQNPTTAFQSLVSTFSPSHFRIFSLICFQSEGGFLFTILKWAFPTCSSQQQWSFTRYTNKTKKFPFSRLKFPEH